MLCCIAVTSQYCPREEQGWLQRWASQCSVWEVFQLGTSVPCRNVLTVVLDVLVALELLLHSLWQRVGTSKAGAAGSALSAGLWGPSSPRHCFTFLVLSLDAEYKETSSKVLKVLQICKEQWHVCGKEPLLGAGKGSLRHRESLGEKEENLSHPALFLVALQCRARAG